MDFEDKYESKNIFQFDSNGHLTKQFQDPH